MTGNLSAACSSSDGEVCLELVTMASPAALTDSGGVIAAVVIILLVVIAVVGELTNFSSIVTKFSAPNFVV